MTKILFIAFLQSVISLWLLELDSPYLVFAVCFVSGGMVSYLAERTKRRTSRRNHDGTFEQSMMVSVIAGFGGSWLYNRGVNGYDAAFYVTALCYLGIAYFGLDKLLAFILSIILKIQIRDKENK